MRHPNIRTCHDGRKFVSILLGGSADGLDCNNSDSLSVARVSEVRRHVLLSLSRHSSIRHWSVAKNFFVDQFGIWDGSDWNNYNILSMPCACNVRFTVS